MTAADARSAFLEVVRNEPGAADDPRRFAGLLADRFEGRWRREAAVLGAAAQEDIPRALRNGRGPFSALAAPLAARLVDERGFDAELARWAVDSWGIALGLTTGEKATAAVPLSCPARDSGGGAVQVVTEPPGAAVELDGRLLGPAPLLAPDVAPGKHSVLCRREGYRDRSGEFDVRPGATTTLRVRLEPAPPPPGTLQVRTVPPGAGLYVDSRYAGTTPVVVPLAAGRGTVLVEAVGKDGQRYREERVVAPGADEILTIDLEAEARRQRQAQEERAEHDFFLLVLLAMIVSVIASILAALFGGSRSK